MSPDAYRIKSHFSRNSLPFRPEGKGIRRLGLPPDVEIKIVEGDIILLLQNPQEIKKDLKKEDTKE